MHRAACPARTPKACHKQIKFWNLQRLFVKSTNQALNRFGCIVCSDDLNMENHTEKDFAPPFNQKQQQKEMRVLRPPNPKQERKKKDRGTLSSEDNGQSHEGTFAFIYRRSLVPQSGGGSWLATFHLSESARSRLSSHTGSARLQLFGGIIDWIINSNGPRFLHFSIIPITSG